jgi:hypothetical protein
MLRESRGEYCEGTQRSLCDTNNRPIRADTLLSEICGGSFPSTLV